jgi:hypothetical protein
MHVRIASSSTILANFRCAALSRTKIAGRLGLRNCGRDHQESQSVRDRFHGTISMLCGVSPSAASAEVLYNGQPHTSDEFDARKTEAALNAVLTVRNGASLPAAYRSVVRGSECRCCRTQ